MTLKLSSPLKFRHYVLAVPTAGACQPFSLDLIRYRGTQFFSLMVPSREADVHKCEPTCDPPEWVLMEGWSQAPEFRGGEVPGWRLVPLASDETYRLDVPDFVERLCQPGYFVVPVPGQRDKRTHLHFAVAQPRFRVRVTLPFNCLRYDRAALLGHPEVSEPPWSVGPDAKFYFVHPAESAKTTHSWHEGHWDSYQWNLEQVNFQDLPQPIREELI